MKQKFFLLMVLLAAAVFLCAAAQAEIRVNAFPGIDAIPEHFDVLEGGIPLLPSAKIESDGKIIVTGLTAWGIAPELMTDWKLSGIETWSATSEETYEDQMTITAKREPNEFVGFPALEIEDGQGVMYLSVGNDYYSSDPSKGAVTVDFRYEDGTRISCEANGLYIEKKEGQTNVSIWYDRSGQLQSVSASVAQPEGFGSIGTYELMRVTDCLTGELFDEITVTGEVDPDTIPIRLAGDAIPRRVIKQEKDPYAFAEGDPALPVLDPLPADALPEVWPAEYPDTFPAFSCEVVDGKYIWTVESLTGWGARVNIPGETYTYSNENLINYFYRAHTLDEVPADQFRIVSEDRNGFFHMRVETEQGPYWMDLEGEACKDGEGNLAPTLWMGLTIQEDRDIWVEYSSDGTTVKKKIRTKMNGKPVAGDYGEDNRLQ